MVLVLAVMTQTVLELGAKKGAVNNQFIEFNYITPLKEYKCL